MINSTLSGKKWVINRLRAHTYIVRNNYLSFFSPLAVFVHASAQACLCVYFFPPLSFRIPLLNKTASKTDSSWTTKKL